MNSLVLCTFLVGYLLVALEGALRIDKAAVALLTAAACWIELAMQGQQGVSALTTTVGEAAQTVFFLLGAMMVVQTVDRHGGFTLIGRCLRCRSKHGLLWRMSLMTFAMSAVLDNMTTSIVMVSIMRQLVAEREDRLRLAAVIILAANAGGACSPIGDVTTIMLWSSGWVTAGGLLRNTLLPCIMACAVPTAVMWWAISGESTAKGKTCGATEVQTEQICGTSPVAACQKIIVLVVGVGGLCLVPVFHAVTGLPPFMGMLLLLGLIWGMTRWGEFGDGIAKDGTGSESVPLASVMFFLGILLAVGALAEAGVLTSMAAWLTQTGVGHEATAAGLGLASAVVDNVPLVAAVMKMYGGNEMVGVLAPNGSFWHLLAYCAGTGGSLLIVGSAAGVVVMGMERIAFGWYLRHVTPWALLGYIAGLLLA